MNIQGSETRNINNYRLFSHSSFPYYGSLTLNLISTIQIWKSGDFLLLRNSQRDYAEPFDLQATLSKDYLLPRNWQRAYPEPIVFLNLRRAGIIRNVFAKILNSHIKLTFIKGFVAFVKVGGLSENCCCKAQ